MSKEEVLKNCRVEESIVYLPDGQLDRKLYTEVKKALELIGGKWKGGKVSGFVFPSDPTDLLAQVSNGEKRNLKKDYQFFATPAELADKLVTLIFVEQGSKILEPSAGQGAIIDAIAREYRYGKIDCYELMDVNRTFLKNNKNANLIGEDFLESIGEEKYDFIVANPPFSRNQDITHFIHMVSHLKPGGKIVCIMSNHWQQSTNKKETAFKEFLNDSKNGTTFISKIEGGAFKESGTSVGAVIVEWIKNLE